MKNLGYVKNNHKRIKRSDEDYDSSTVFFEGLSSTKSRMAETTESEFTDTIQSQSTEFSTPETDIETDVDFGNLHLTTIRTTVSEMLEYQDEVNETTLTGGTDEINLNRSVEESTTSNIETSEDYDYDKLKAEYYYQIQEIQRRNETFNYTDQGESEETVEDAVKKIIDFKMPRNCTKEELSQIGVKAFECLIFDYQHAKNKTDVKKVLDRTWMVIKIWVLIYFCIAIPCWCQKGINFD